MREDCVVDIADLKTSVQLKGMMLSLRQQQDHATHRQTRRNSELSEVYPAPSHLAQNEPSEAKHFFTYRLTSYRQPKRSNSRG